MDKSNAELQSWGKAMQKYYEWCAIAFFRLHKAKEHGTYALINEFPVNEKELSLMLEELREISTPKHKECKKIQKTLEESIKNRIKGLKYDVKAFEDPSSRSKTAAAAFWMAQALELQKESKEKFASLFKE